jgi:hypothetical protein
MRLFMNWSPTNFMFVLEDIRNEHLRRRRFVERSTSGLFRYAKVSKNLILRNASERIGISRGQWLGCLFIGVKEIPEVFKNRKVCWFLRIFVEFSWILGNFVEFVDFKSKLWKGGEFEFRGTFVSSVTTFWIRKRLVFNIRNLSS